MQKTHADEAASSGKLDLLQWLHDTGHGFSPTGSQDLGRSRTRTPKRTTGTAGTSSMPNQLSRTTTPRSVSVAPTFGKRSVGCRTQPGVTPMAPGGNESCQGTPVVFGASPCCPHSVKSTLDGRHRSVEGRLFAYCFGDHSAVRCEAQPLRTDPVAERDAGPLLGWHSMSRRKHT